MKKVLALFILSIFSISVGFTQISFTAKTGDAELDLSLSDMNGSAKGNLTLFKKDLAVNFNVTEGKLDELMVSYNMQPADLFMALQVAKLATKPVDQVAVNFKSNKTKGWGVIAKEMGIKPGSKEFHALKDGAKEKNNKMKENKGKEKSKENGKNNGSNGKSKKK